MMQFMFLHGFKKMVMLKKTKIVETISDQLLLNACQAEHSIVILSSDSYRSEVSLVKTDPFSNTS
jgi:hypothetical protein